MAKRLPAAKRARRANPRIDRNNHDNILDFASYEPNTRKGKRDRFNQNRSEAQDGFQRQRKVDLIPRNLAQENYLEHLSDETNYVVFGIGLAGTGKTLLATQYAINDLISGKIKKIIITRPAVSNDEEHGFLPGDLNEKMAPWTRPIMDVFKEVYGVPKVTKMLEHEVIEIAPLAYLRGRTFKNAIVIADEMQNATPSQMKMLLTRLGEGSRMFVTGDLNQSERNFVNNNGLKDFCNQLSARGGSDMFAICEFGIGDVERHPAVAEALRIYGDE